MTHIHSFFHRLAHDEASNHTTGERVTCTVRVDNVSSIDLRRRVRNGGRLALHCPDGRLCSMCNKDCARLRHLGWRVGNLLRDGTEIVRFHARCLSPGLSFRLVADHKLGIRHHLIYLRLEELRNEGSRQVEGEWLARFFGMLRNDQSTFHTVRKEEATNVEELGCLNSRLGFLRVQMRFVKLLSSAKVCAKRAVMACNHHSARACWRVIHDLVDRLQTFTLIRSTQLLSKIIVADTSKIRSRSLGQGVLRAASCVLSSTTSDVRHLVVFD